MNSLNAEKMALVRLDYTKIIDSLKLDTYITSKVWTKITIRPPKNKDLPFLFFTDEWWVYSDVSDDGRTTSFFVSLHFRFVASTDWTKVEMEELMDRVAHILYQVSQTIQPATILWNITTAEVFAVERDGWNIFFGDDDKTNWYFSLIQDFTIRYL